MKPLLYLIIFVLSLFAAHFIQTSLYSPLRLRASPVFYFLSLCMCFAGILLLYGYASNRKANKGTYKSSSASVAGGIYGDLNQPYPLPEIKQEETETQLDDFARVSTPKAFIDKSSSVDPNVCVTGDWIDFDQTCNPATGTKTQVRTVLQWPKDPNVSCGNLTRYVPCAVDCTASDWTGWSACDPTTGMKTRSKSVLMPPQNGGASCGPLLDSQPCPVDCKVSSWSDWSVCDTSNQSQSRVRSVTVPPINSGLACGELQQSRTC